MDYISQHIQATAANHAVRARMDRGYAAAEAASHVDDLDAMTFAQLLQLARQLKVPGRGTARVGQLREGIRSAWADARADRVNAAAEAAQTIGTPAGKIRVGSVIVASARLGGNAQYTVLEVDEDIKNGYAGWEAEGRWGYADQVLRVVKF